MGCAGVSALPLLFSALLGQDEPDAEHRKDDYDRDNPTQDHQNQPKDDEVSEYVWFALWVAGRKVAGLRHRRIVSRQIGIPQSGNQRSSSGSIGSSADICAFNCSSRSVARSLASPGSGTNGYQQPRL